MRNLRILPAVYARISCSLSSFTRKLPSGSTSVTVPSNSRSSSFAMRDPLGDLLARGSVLVTSHLGGTRRCLHERDCADVVRRTRSRGVTVSAIVPLLPLALALSLPVVPRLALMAVLGTALMGVLVAAGVTGATAVASPLLVVAA